MDICLNVLEDILISKFVIDLEIKGIDLIEKFLSKSEIEFFSYSTTIEFDHDVPLSKIFQENKNPVKFYFSSLNNTVLGLGISKEIKANNQSSLDTLEDQFNKVNQSIYELNDDREVIWLGGASFYPTIRHTSEWSEWKPINFHLPNVTLIQSTLRSIKVQIILKKSNTKEIQQNINEIIGEIYQNSHTSSLLEENKSGRCIYQTSKETWTSYVENALALIHENNLEKIVLSRVRKYEILNFNNEVLLNTLRERFPNTYLFNFQKDENNQFFGASPELLFEINKLEFTTFALAGSIARGKTQEEDKHLENQLLNSPKNQKEHQFVVDYISECLKDYVTNLTFDTRPQLVKLDNIQHLKTKIKARVRPERSIFSIISSMHPTPALAGTPVREAMLEISRIEEHERGWYGSPVGWISSEGNCEIAVGIRSALKNGSELILFSGAGLVDQSNPEEEWIETEVKFKAIEGAFIKI